MDYGLLALVICAAVAINTPFGAWRATTRKFSWQWFVAIHAPIPFVFIVRRTAGFGWDYVPVMLACCVTGQFLGSWLYHRVQRRRHPAAEDSTEPAAALTEHTGQTAHGALVARVAEPEPQATVAAPRG
jgi:hypothetical protein